MFSILAFFLIFILDLTDNKNNDSEELIKLDKKLLPELFVLRTISCLAILLIHSVNWAFDTLTDTHYISRLFLSFGTPAFIMISEIILAHAYPTHLPPQFFSKRIRGILIPFVIACLFYAIVNAFTQGGIRDIPYLSLKYIFLGEGPPYFILIIFQFYLLHPLAIKIFKRFTSTKILSFSLFINLIYLAIFNFIPAPSYGEYIWEHFYIIPFVGWIFYFALGFYIGSHYEACKIWLGKHWKALLSTWIGTIVLIALFYQQHWITQMTSKRVDVFLYSVCTILVLLLLASLMKSIPHWVIRISQCSFGIYLYHQFVQQVIRKGMSFGGWFENQWFGVVIIFFLSLFICMAATYLLNYFRFGKYITGKLGISLKK